MDTPASPPVETVPISRLYCSPTNPRRNDAAVPHVAASIRRFAWQQPIVARRSGEVIAGNTRLKAAQSLGMTEVPVWWFEGSDLDAVAYGITDNRSHSWAEWDEPALAKLLEQLRHEDSLEGVGFSTEDIDALVAQLREQEDVELNDEGPEEPPAVAMARTGDLWILGDHRLLCGDSTNFKDVLRVMDGEKAARGLDEGPKRGWMIVSMKDDWKSLFAPQRRAGYRGRPLPRRPSPVLRDPCTVHVAASAAGASP